MSFFKVSIKYYVLDDIYYVITFYVLNNMNYILKITYCVYSRHYEIVKKKIFLLTYKHNFKISELSFGFFSETCPEMFHPKVR